MRAALVAAALALGLAGCGGPCPDFGPYAVWTEPDLYGWLALLDGQAAGPRVLDDGDLHATLERANATGFAVGPRPELERLWGAGYAVAEAAWAPRGAEGPAFRLNPVEARMEPMPDPQRPEEHLADATAFLSEVLDGTAADVERWARQLSAHGWLRTCDGLADCADDGTFVGPRMPDRVAALYASRSDWRLEDEPREPIDESRRFIPFESEERASAGGWTLTFALPVYHVHGTDGRQPFEFRVTAEGLAMLHLRPPDRGSSRWPEPELADVQPAARHVLDAAGFKGPAFAGYQEGPGAYEQTCIL